MSATIVLYDAARKGGNACWSPNVWKTRLVLNYKNIPYHTEFLTHPEIAPKFQAMGLEPNTAGPGSPYTIPTIQLPDGTPIMDSAAIAEALELQHPTPSLHLDNKLHEAVAPILGKIGLPLLPVLFPRIGRDMIPESAVDWFEEARAQRVGMPLAEFERQKGGPQAWAAAKPGLDELKAFVVEQKKDEGPFVLGSQVCYADFLIAGVIESLSRIGPDLYESYVGPEVELRALHEACRQWMQKDQ